MRRSALHSRDAQPALAGDAGAQAQETRMLEAVTREDVVNTLPLDKQRKELGRKRAKLR
jgi:hypothetical protein